eukprot:jgi/Undpi1/5401/HiC_scaffold_2.g00682.m1
MSPYAMAPSVLCRAAWRAGGRRSIAAAAASRSDRGRKGVPGGVGDGRPLTLTSLMSSKGCGMRPPLAGAGTAVDGRGDGFGVNGVSASSVSPGFDTDLLVIGCGIAGSATALQAARLGMQVTMLSSAANEDDCNSFWAQGGIIYKAEDDTPELLASDVHIAGAGICDDSAVMKLAVEGPKRVEEMLLTGTAEVPFDRNSKGELALCLEASHNRARIIHWRDETGKAITTTVQAAAATHPNIRLMTATTAVDMAMAGGQCVGAHVLIEVRLFFAREWVVFSPPHPLPPCPFPAAFPTVLATGGLGDLYAHTSNPSSAKGAGVAMALRAGADLSGMEYVQFHPTTLHLPGQRSFLLTEALRGEGARLVDERGRHFASDYHPDGELAPRDVVSRTILSEMRLQKASHMYLDISHRESDWIRGRFPSIADHCRNQGLDMTTQPLPVVPAAHYFCGGVTTDLTGRTTVRGLFAAGEVACTGLHGANRLASTSLLEGLVWGCSIAEHLADRTMPDSRDALAASADMAALEAPNVPGNGAPEASPVAIDSAWKEIRSTMWEDVGVVRKTSGLREGARALSKLAKRCTGLYETSKLCPDTVEVRNGAQTGAMIAAAAAANPLSVGTHFVEEDETHEEEEEVQVAARG